MEIFFIYGLTSEKSLRYACLIFLIFSGITFTAGQEPGLKSTQIVHQLLDSRGEAIIRFVKSSHIDLSEVSKNISIDNYHNDTITAYVNSKGFSWFADLQIPFEVIPPPSLNISPTPQSYKKITDSLNYYPSYGEYINLMNDFETAYPELCRVRDFGSTVDGHKLLVVKISDNPDLMENEPVFFYSATMHGDEPVGYVLMLKLIDHLLKNYESDPDIRDIIDKTEIWINPLANPDGIYFVADSTIFGSTRFNKNNVDLNRDFPIIPEDTKDSSERQPETLHMMRLMEDIRPSLAANFHSGAEVVNYPWDTWITYHPDDSWYRSISHKYADTVHNYAPDNYMTFRNNGITRGIDWYQVSGSRQDYMNYYMHGREVTIELSNEKIPPAHQIEDFWNYNRKSLLQFISNSHIGFSGTVTDSVSGDPLYSRVRIINHDRSPDNSFIFTRADNGNYLRLIGGGNYRVVFSATGHKYKIVSITVNPRELTTVDVKLSSGFEMTPYPNPFFDKFMVDIPYSGYMLDITFIDLTGKKVRVIHRPVKSSGMQEIDDFKDLAPGYYIVHMYYNNQRWQFKCVKTSP